MKPNFKRADRVTEMIQRSLAEILQKGLKGYQVPPFVTISAVKMTNDLEHAKVYFTVFNKDPAETARLLNTAAGYLRSLLAKCIKARTVPQLHFIYDESIEYARHLTKLIDEVNPADNGDE